MTINQLLNLISTGTFICAAIVALTTLVGLHLRNAPSLMTDQRAALLRWHRWSGWLAFSGLVLSSVIGLFIKDHQFPSFTLISSIHPILILLCAAAVLRKILKQQRKLNWRRAEIFLWAVPMITLGTFFSLFTYALAAYRYSGPTFIWVENIHFTSPLLTFAHVSLAVGLIWMGRLVLRSRNRSNLQDISRIRNIANLFGRAVKSSK
jgi:hypothetical protein